MWLWVRKRFLGGPGERPTAETFPHTQRVPEHPRSQSSVVGCVDQDGARAEVLMPPPQGQAPQHSPFPCAGPGPLSVTHAGSRTSYVMSKNFWHARGPIPNNRVPVRRGNPPESVDREVHTGSEAPQCGEGTSYTHSDNSCIYCPRPWPRHCRDRSHRV